MSREIQEATENVAKRLASGEPELFLVRKYENGDGEFVNLAYLLAYDIFSSVFFPVDDTIRKLFPVESLVWLKKEKEGMRVTEATRQDEKAEDSYQTALRKLRSYKDEEIKQNFSMRDGQNRIFCSRKKGN